jgi:transcriptional regulator GlxA family with amidase domain
MRFGIFIYDGVEPIDLATFGVLSMARRIAPQIEICTIAPQAGPVVLANGLTVTADFGIDDAPSCDLVIVTGGPGWVEQAEAPATLDYIRRVRASGRIASVCTGAMILAASGILAGGPATTKREVVPPETSPLEVMRANYPEIEVRAAMLVDRGGLVTGGGVSLCIDTTLHLLADMLGQHTADETARIMEYQRAWRANREAFAPVLVPHQSGEQGGLGPTRRP